MTPFPLRRPHPDMETYRGEGGTSEPDMSPYRERKDAERGVPVGALQAALAAEHAAVWAYGLAGAFISGTLAGQLGKAETVHMARRDATERALIDAGARPVQPEPGYLTPEPVTNAASALRLAITAETDAAAAWRSVIARSPADPDVRESALDALTTAAVQATRWRAAADADPATVPFPGAP